MTVFMLAVYSKYPTKTKIKAMLKESDENKKNPPIDLQDPVSGRYGTPEEIRKATGLKEIVVTNHPKRSWFGTFKYNESRKTWSFS